MENEKICKIVQDLLPNYIENLTSEETNIFIEEHLNTCSNCKNILENMKNDLNPTSTHKDNREIKYMKKYNNKMRILKIIIFTVILWSINPKTSKSTMSKGPSTLIISFLPITALRAFFIMAT